MPLRSFPFARIDVGVGGRQPHSQLQPQSKREPNAARIPNQQPQGQWQTAGAPRLPARSAAWAMIGSGAFAASRTASAARFSVLGSAALLRHQPLVPRAQGQPLAGDGVGHGRGTAGGQGAHAPQG